MNTVLPVILMVAQIAYFICWRHAPPGGTWYLNLTALLSFYAMNLLVGVALASQPGTKSSKTTAILCALLAIALAIAGKMGPSVI